MRHADGPWEQVGARVGNDAYGIIAETFGKDYLGNARLIAAAPEMLAALRGVVAAHDREGYDIPWGDVRAAVARAEGRADP